MYVATLKREHAFVRSLARSIGHRYFFMSFTDKLIVFTNFSTSFFAAIKTTKALLIGCVDRLSSVIHAQPIDRLNGINLNQIREAQAKAKRRERARP